MKKLLFLMLIIILSTSAKAQMFYNNTGCDVSIGIMCRNVCAPMNVCNMTAVPANTSIALSSLSNCCTNYGYYVKFTTGCMFAAVVCDGINCSTCVNFPPTVPLPAACVSACCAPVVPNAVFWSMGNLYVQ